jgi:hypothetical protein
MLVLRPALGALYGLGRETGRGRGEVGTAAAAYLRTAAMIWRLNYWPCTRLWETHILLAVKFAYDRQEGDVYLENFGKILSL